MPTPAPRILLPSLLLRILGRLRWLAGRGAVEAFLTATNAREEVFLPFVYVSGRGSPRFSAGLARLGRRFAGREFPTVFHAPFTGRRGPFPPRFARNLADPAAAKANRRALVEECAFLKRVRQTFALDRPLVYVVHLGRRRAAARDPLAVPVAVLTDVLPAAAASGVLLAVENISDRVGDTDFLGARLDEIGEILERLGGARPGWSTIGWTFDVAHALLAYRGDLPAVRTAFATLAEDLVHVHVNAPRRAEALTWADRHEAPSDLAEPCFDLLRLALRSRRFREFGTVTYEVNWGTKFLNPLLGGSSLAALARGYVLLRQVLTEEAMNLDATEVLAYARDRSAEA